MTGPGHHDGKRKGRGALSNRSGRFEALTDEGFDDGWPREIEERSSPATRLLPDHTRSIVASNESPDVPFDISINPYRGCEHGCIYCFARPSHAYLGMSPGLDFETRIFSKTDAPQLLRRYLSRPSYRCRILALGANTDAYQPVEARARVTRSILEVLGEFSHPVALLTKSALVTRDVDILSSMASRRLAQVSVSLTTLDPELARVMEPRASTPARRLQTIRELSSRGIPVAVLTAPMIPGLNDWELERLLEAAAGAGATTASWVLLRLPLEIGELFTEWLREHFPDRAERVLGLIRQTRGGDLYRSEFGSRMRGSGPYAEILQQRFDVATRRLGLDERAYRLDTSAFRVPPAAPGEASPQLGLFGG
ncbi:MAG TPA: PA0069 family radical SAM protein [Candidatus Binatia bacterium]|jgi:DNA repair photolyase